MILKAFIFENGFIFRLSFLKMFTFLCRRKVISKLYYKKVNFISNFANKNKTLDMNQAYFKHDRVESKLKISFRYIKQITDTKKIDRNFNFVRNIDEKIDVAMNRIKNNLERELKVKSKKKNKNNDKNQDEEKDLEVRLNKLSNYLILIN